MNLQQIKYLCAVVDHGLNVSVAAEALFTSQPGISKQVRQLEDELGLSIFVRQGKRLAVADAGRRDRRRHRAPRAARDRQPEARRRRIPRRGHRNAVDRHHPHAGALRAAARCCANSPRAIPRSRSSCTRAIRCRSPSRRRKGDVDIGIATEALADFPELVTLPCYEWNRVVLVPKRHPLAKTKPLTLEALAKFPIVTYDFSFTGRSAINAAFAAQRPRAQRRAHRARRRRDQDLRRTRHGRRHRRADGLRPRARHRVRDARRRPPVRAVDDAARACATACSCAASCTRSSRCSRRSTIAPRSTPRWKAAPRDERRAGTRRRAATASSAHRGDSRR